MKKLLLSILALGMMASVSAQQLQHKLMSVSSSDNMESMVYTYDNMNRCIDIYTELYGSMMEKIHDSLFYDERGDMVRQEGWQLIQGAWKKVYFVEFTYNDNHQVLTRKNYNSFNDFMLNATYTVTYNEQGQKERIDLDFFDINPFSSIRYVYNNGRIEMEEWSDYDFDSGTTPVTTRVYYSYNNNNNAVTAREYYDVYGASESMQSIELFTYDNNGNCIQREKQTPSGMVTERFVYKDFSNNLVADAVMPYTPENMSPWGDEFQRPTLYGNTNLYTTEEWWAQNDADELVYVCDYDYMYATGVGLDEIEVEDIKLYPNPASDMVNIDMEKDAQVYIYNENGQIAMVSKTHNNTINVSMLKNGMYILGIKGDNGMRYTKLNIAR